MVVETPFYNVLLLQVDDIPAFLAAVEDLVTADPTLAHDIARILPLTETFAVRNVAELENRFATTAAEWLDRLVGRSFHVRFHARGWGKQTSRLAEERALDDVLLSALAERSESGRIAFADPDAVIDVEVVAQRAGMALWTREDLQHHTFLRID